MTSSYERIKGRRDLTRNILNQRSQYQPQHSLSSEGEHYEQFRIQVNQITLNSHNHDKNPNIPVAANIEKSDNRSQQSEANLINKPTTSDNPNSIRYIDKDIDLRTRSVRPGTHQLPNFDDYDPNENNPLGKMDGLQARSIDMTISQNIRYLLGIENARTNKGYWRIIDAGTNIQQENSITFSRLLVVVWIVLPDILLSYWSLYWVCAMVLSAIFQSSKGFSWFISTYIVAIVLEVIFKILQIRGRTKQAAESDERICIRYDTGACDWVQTEYEKLNAGDYVRLKVGDEFPCDCIILQAKNSRQVSIGQSAIKGIHSPVIIKETVTSDAKIPLTEMMIFCKQDTVYDDLKQWTGKLQTKEKTYSLSYDNIGLRGSINLDEEELICIVLYTSCNNKAMEVVQHPRPVKSRIVQTRLNKLISISILIAIVMAIIHGLISNSLYTNLLPTKNYLIIRPSFGDSCVFFAKYIGEFSVAIPIFAKILYQIYSLISAWMVKKDPLYSNNMLEIYDTQAINEMSQAQVIISHIDTYFRKPKCVLKSIRIKQLVYNLGDSTNHFQQKDLQMIFDFIQAAQLSCQEFETSPEKEAILKSGSKFGIKRDYTSNLVRFKGFNLQETISQNVQGSVTAELIKQLPSSQDRPFNLTFYQQKRSRNILCLLRSKNPEYIIKRLYNRETEMSRLVRRMEEEGSYSQILGKTSVNPADFSKFMNTLENGNMAQLNKFVLQLINQTQILGVLVYENPFSDDLVRTLNLYYEANICNLVLCPEPKRKTALLRQLKLPFEEVTQLNFKAEVDNILPRIRKQAKILTGELLEKGLPSDDLSKIIKGNLIIILTSYNTAHLALLMRILEENKVTSIGISECQETLSLLKYSSVGVALVPESTPAYSDILRYADIRLKTNNPKHFLKLLLVHSRVMLFSQTPAIFYFIILQHRFIGVAKLIGFLFQKSLLVLFCEFLYSFYTLSTNVNLVPVNYQYSLDVLLFSLTPLAYFLFEGDFNYNTMTTNPGLVRVLSKRNYLGGTHYFKRLLLVLIQSILITFVVIHSIQDVFNEAGQLVGHEFTGFVVFFCIYHILLFKMLFLGERITFYQLLVVGLSLPLFYLVMGLFSNKSIANASGLNQISILTQALTPKSFAIGVVVVAEALCIDAVYLVYNKIFSKVNLKKPEAAVQEQPRMPESEKNLGEVSAEKLVVFDMG